MKLTAAGSIVGMGASWTFHGVMPGQLGSKSNSRKLVTIHGRPAFIKSADARKYMDDFVRLFKTAKPFEGNIRFSAIVYYVDRRRDLDVALIQDCLQKAGIIKNDRQVQEIHAFRKIDKLNPRTIFTLEEIQ